MKKIKAAIVGAGERGVWNFGKILSERGDVEITALCDPNPVRMHEAARALGIRPGFFPSITAMLEKDRPDFAIITSPDCFHEENAVEAMKNGLHVLIDKPLATTAAACLRIIEASKKSGRVAMMGFNLRYYPVLRALKRIVDQGRLGKVFLIENREFYGGGRTYMARWNRHYAKSGGLWIHKGAHDFDVFNWLLGFPRPVRVSASAGVNVFKPDQLPFTLKKGKAAGPTCLKCHYQKLCPDVKVESRATWTGKAQAVDGYSRDVCIYLSDKDVHDNGIALIEYENGARASHLECFTVAYTDRLYSVVGDRGMAEASLEEHWIKVRPRWSGKEKLIRVPKDTGTHGGADRQLVEAFLKVIRGKIQVPTLLAHGLWATAVGQMAEISWREGRAVSVKELSL
ncbi:MAG: Gfo/Idh/MocA family oxidoreductase [Fibrobacterota bacterium]